MIRILQETVPLYFVALELADLSDDKKADVISWLRTTNLSFHASPGLTLGGVDYSIVPSNVTLDKDVPEFIRKAIEEAVSFSPGHCTLCHVKFSWLQIKKKLVCGPK